MSAAGTQAYGRLAHGHPAMDGPAPGPLIVVALTALVVAAYFVAASRLRRRGDAWPWARDAAFGAGGVALAAAAAGPLPGEPFTAHMTQHLALGMAAPLLLVLGRPLTLLLRTLRPGALRRRVLAFAHSRPVGLLVSPPVAMVLDMGGLWVLYRTPLLAATHDRPWLHALVHLHVVAAGALFAFAICQLDPARRRWSLRGRGAALLIGGAAHAVLAKTLYATAPPGTSFAAADLRSGSMIMYYGGDLIEVALATVLAVQWYRAVGRARTRAGRRPALT